jgi:hypothetical protein
MGADNQRRWPVLRVRYVCFVRVCGVCVETVQTGQAGQQTTQSHLSSCCRGGFVETCGRGATSAAPSRENEAAAAAAAAAKKGIASRADRAVSGRYSDRQAEQTVFNDRTGQGRTGLETNSVSVASVCFYVG